MDYFTFQQNIIQALRDSLGTDVTITVQDVVKNNHTHLDGLSILAPNCNLSPTIYLNHYYSQYQNGMDFSGIVSEILNIYQENCPSENIDVSFFTEYDKIKPKIIFKLINYGENRDLLSQVPHFRFLDLALVFCCLLHSSPTGSATILIYNHHLRFWDATKDDLYRLASQNTPRLLSATIQDMADVLTDLLQQPDTCLSEDDGQALPQMYVLTNQNKLNGAACMLYPDLLKKFADRMESDLCILPSSIHEVLLLPVSGKNELADFSDIVAEVNSAQVSPEEILSGHAYYFSRESGQISF